MLDQGVLRCKHQIRSSKERVGTCGKHRYGVRRVVYTKLNLSPFTLSDPVTLHVQGGRGPLQRIEVLEQAFGIGRDAEHPLAHGAAFDGIALILPLIHFLVRQHRAKGFAPVHGNVGDVGKAMCVAIQLDVQRVGDVGWYRQLADVAGALLLGIVPGIVDAQEHPLRPADVVFGRSIHLP